MHRRHFIARSTGWTTAAWTAGRLAAPATARSGGANQRIGVAVMGLRGRGGRLLSSFAQRDDVEVLYVCDVDRRVLSQRLETTEKQTGRRPQAITDFRKALDDPAVDALVNGAPDHWHAIPTIMACQAGKDVYVEKPDGHNILESRTMVAAARKYGRIVQMGTQGRSAAHLLEAMKYLEKGSLGTVRFAKGWESSRQGSIGHPPDSQPPPEVDYDMWLGPAPKRPFNIRRFHGCWRWFFDYGTGDLGNDGVHLLDMARRALETAAAAQGETVPRLPEKVSAHGGKYYFDDDQQWPDTMMVTYDYNRYVITYELRIWSPYPLEGEREGACVCGDEGYMVLGHRRWRAFDRQGRQVAEGSGPDSTGEHVANFLECMRSRQKPAADLETVGHFSSLLCHLGNAAWRAGRTLEYDPQTGTFPNDPEANQFLTRPQYRPPWLLPAASEL
ncbi:MAG TPA: Gfo/Idh/MocA family oxidoreductase [Planctomycetaceae bacterium]|nr:Gfo/Idh/MocA family oxidoreductase [Planctomycetaceae bacterium]